MLYMSKICGYLKILADDEVNDSVSIHFSDNCILRSNVEVLNVSDPEVQLVNAKPIIKCKLKVCGKCLKSIYYQF